MEEYLKNKSLNVEGKKLIILIYNALNSKQTVNSIIFQYLDDLKNDVKSNKDKHILKMISFIYHGSMQRVANFKSYKDYNTNYNAETGEEIESVTQLNKWPKNEVLDFIDEAEPNYNSEISSGSGFFIWITLDTEKDDLSYKLGLEFPDEHLVNIKFPHNKYELHYPTFIEADGYEWFYANRNSKEKCGKTINILNVNNSSKEDELIGLTEVLCKPIQFTKDIQVAYLIQVQKDKDFFQDKLDIFHSNINTSYFNEEMIKNIIDKYEAQ